MRINPNLPVAIFVAIGWALFVFGTYFLLIYAPSWPFTRWPFSDWSASDQAQLFQGMVGIAGFGGGIVALFFAGQQLAHVFADPKLSMRFRYYEANYWEREPMYVEDEFLTDQLRPYVLVEIVNQSPTICSVWQVDVRTASPGLSFEYVGKWSHQSPTHVSRQPGESDSLYPDSPHPIDGVQLQIDEQFITDGHWAGELTARIVTERRSREQRLRLRYAAAAEREQDTMDSSLRTF